jgi:hypothetical protein
LRRIFVEASMLTFFTTAKPFRGHTEIIQRNALESWRRVHPDAEIILFGDDFGAAEVSRELGLRHESYVERNAFGTKRLDYLFTTARALSRYDVLCYVNCDIVLMQDFQRAVARVKDAHGQFLMIGRRWDLEVCEPMNFVQPNWQSRLESIARSRGRQRTPEWIDYFVFTRGLYGSSVPPFVVGRVHWDNWLVWKARSTGAAVVDASQQVLAIHQNHDYGYHPQGMRGVWHGVEANRNYQLAGGWRHLRTVADATHVLGPLGLKPNAMRHWKAVERYTNVGLRWLQCDVWQPAWFFLLGLTRPMRHALGLRAAAMQRRSRA